ncbi:MAG: hypothetical protein EON61_22910, partial [Alphaproteobacteria bacterium]
MATVSTKGGEPLPVVPERTPLLRNGTTLSGSVLALAHGIILSHFFGPLVGAGWAFAAVALLVWVVHEALEAAAGKTKAVVRFNLVQLAMVTLWMASAVAIFITGSPGAWIIAITVPASWAIHIIFAGKSDLNVVLRALAVCSAPMVGFMLYSSWTSFPMWVAIPCSISALAMVASIAESARYSTRNFAELQKALIESSTTKERLEFAIQSAG